MATIAENLQTIIDIKADIKTAIENKGVTVGDAGFGEYASKIDSIDGSGSTSIDVAELGIKFAYSSFSEIPSIFDITNVTDMNHMFGNCHNLTSVPFFDTSNVTDMGDIFRNTDSLLSIPQYNTSKVTDMTRMFYFSGIEIIPKLDCSKVTSMADAFYGCKQLSSVGGFENFGKGQITEVWQNDISIWLPSSNLLSYESCMNIINNVYDMTSFDYSRTASIKFHATPYALLSADDIAIATSKGWIVESA